MRFVAYFLMDAMMGGSARSAPFLRCFSRVCGRARGTAEGRGLSCSTNKKNLVGTTQKHFLLNNSLIIFDFEELFTPLHSTPLLQTPIDE